MEKINEEKFKKMVDAVLAQAKDTCNYVVIGGVYDWFYNILEDGFEYDYEGMFYVVRDMMNFDWFWIRNGKVDVKEANYPEVAELVAPFVDREMAEKLLDTF